jgi:hypothetical protein
MTQSAVPGRTASATLGILVSCHQNALPVGRWPDKWPRVVGRDPQQAASAHPNVKGFKVTGH